MNGGSLRAAALGAALAASCLGASPIRPRDHITVRIEVTTPMSRETRLLTLSDGATYHLERITTDGKLATSCRRSLGSGQRIDALLRAQTAAAGEAWRPHYGLGNAPTDERMLLTVRDTTTHAEQTTVVDDPGSVPVGAMPPGLRSLIDAVGAYVRGC